jgi:glutamate dehydrogenase
LDLTDNLVHGAVVPPVDLHRRDGDDTYLVVAADKGTASFSDIANAKALEYGFWLGDAFASGGSVGYDHKAMGITARGAWESVKRHFLEMGVDTQSESFTVVGIGDMSGDVFGNGMLLSEHIGWSQPSTTGTSSSIPRRIRRPPSRSANASSSCPGRAGRTTTRS